MRGKDSPTDLQVVSQRKWRLRYQAAGHLGSKRDCGVQFKMAASRLCLIHFKTCACIAEETGNSSRLLRVFSPSSTICKPLSIIP
ncbi:unnamed protein product [Boreogadus saida]